MEDFLIEYGAGVAANATILIIAALAGKRELMRVINSIIDNCARNSRMRYRNTLKEMDERIKKRNGKQEH